MEQLAIELYRTDKTELTSKQILLLSKELNSPEQQGEMEGSLREILTCSFLIRDSDRYRFSHQSFMEYLVACRLAKDIMTDKQENFRSKPISLTIRGFLLELEAFSENSRKRISHFSNTITYFDYRKLMTWFYNNTKENAHLRQFYLFYGLFATQQPKRRFGCVFKYGAELLSSFYDSAGVELSAADI